MVTDDPIGVGRGRASLRIGGSNLSVQVVVEAIEKTFAQVHVTDRVDALREVHAARHLAVSVSPMVLDTFHVPLVDDNDYFLTICLVDLSEEILVSLVNHYLFKLGEEDVGRLDVPVHFIGVQDFLSV